MAGEGEKVRAVKFHGRECGSVSHEWPPRVQFAKTAAPNANWGRQLERVGVPGTLAKTGGAEAPSSELLKLEAQMMKPQVLRGICGLCRNGLHERPISAMYFFNVGLWRSIAVEISADQEHSFNCDQ